MIASSPDSPEAARFRARIVRAMEENIAISSCLRPHGDPIPTPQESVWVHGAEMLNDQVGSLTVALAGTAQFAMRSAMEIQRARIANGKHPLGDRELCEVLRKRFSK